jgi:hypothetical protein
MAKVRRVQNRPHYATQWVRLEVAFMHRLAVYVDRLLLCNVTPTPKVSMCVGSCECMIEQTSVYGRVFGHRISRISKTCYYESATMWGILQGQCIPGSNAFVCIGVYAKCT